MGAVTLSSDSQWWVCLYIVPNTMPHPEGILCYQCSSWRGLCTTAHRIHQVTFGETIQASNEKVINKNRVIRTATRGLKQVYDLQLNALTSLVHFALQLHKVN